MVIHFKHVILMKKIFLYSLGFLYICILDNYVQIIRQEKLLSGVEYSQQSTADQTDLMKKKCRLKKELSQTLSSIQLLEKHLEKLGADIIHTGNAATCKYFIWCLCLRNTVKMAKTEHQRD